MTGLDLLRWILALALAFLLGKLVTKLKLPSILGWLIGGMMLGPHALALLPQHVLDDRIYKTIITWMQVSFGLMLGTELILRKIKSYGKALMITTLTQSLGTFLIVSLVFAVVFLIRGVPVYLAFAFGGIALATGFPAGLILRKMKSRAGIVAVLLIDITCTAVIGILLNRYVFTTITLNYMLMGVSASAVFSNMITEEQLDLLISLDQPILGISLLGAIVDLGAPLNYHLILGAGLYTFIYIGARAFGKYFGARIGATATHMPKTVQKYLGLTLLPHSGVSLVFTGIICGVLQGPRPDLAAIVQGTIAAAAVINEIIAVIAAKKGFELAGEIGAAASQ